MSLVCWLLDHRWFDTVLTHVDFQPNFDDPEWERGVFKERICLRCRKEEAVYQERLHSWNIVLDQDYVHTPTEHFSLQRDWSG